MVVGDRTYLVDAGSGVGRQFVRAGLEFTGLRGIFITHLHSDHVIDLAALMMFGIMRLPVAPTHEIPIFGPGPRGTLPPVSSRAAGRLTPVFPDNPTPGTTEMVDHLLRGFATDINDRKFDALKSTPLDWFHPREIEIPADIGYHPDDDPTPDMEPFVVFEDEAVRVSTILVRHAPMAPAFGYRFETPAGVVVVSGDTGPTQNMVRLARGADLLLHEALDLDWVQRQYDAAGRDESAAAIRDHHLASHTSPAEAVRIAHEAGVRQLALHHLVSHAESSDIWVRQAGSFDGQILVPDDLDVIPLR